MKHLWASTVYFPVAGISNFERKKKQQRLTVKKKQPTTLKYLHQGNLNFKTFLLLFYCRKIISPDLCSVHLQIRVKVFFTSSPKNTTVVYFL